MRRLLPCLAVLAAGCAGARSQTTKARRDAGGDEVVAVREDGRHFVVRRAGARLVRPVPGGENVEFQAIDTSPLRTTGMALTVGGLVIGALGAWGLHRVANEAEVDPNDDDDADEAALAWGLYGFATVTAVGGALALAGGAAWIGAEVVGADPRPYATARWRVEF